MFCVTIIVSFKCFGQVRLKADKNYLKAAERMAKKYNKGNDIICFAEGDIVSVRIPRIDRTNSDIPRLPCVVVEVRYNVYRLR